MNIVDTLRTRKTFLSTVETMEILGQCRKTILRWTNSGKLPAFRVGSGNRYNPSVILAHLEARKIGGQQRLVPNRPTISRPLTRGAFCCILTPPCYTLVTLFSGFRVHKRSKQSMIVSVSKDTNPAQGAAITDYRHDSMMA